MSVPPRLIDLSIARPLERAARLRHPVGTDAYMAPEQCDPKGNEGRIGPLADVWGLGATLFHAAAGERPFPRPEGARDSEQPEVRFPQLVEHPGDMPASLPAPFVELVEGMLARDPGDRPSAAEVAAELEPLVAALPRKLSLSRRGARLI
jgi:serine/threonine protein kinase